jgi:hypothetical protein
MKLARWEPFKEADDLFRQFGAPVFGRMPRLFEGSGEIAETD